MANKRSAEMRAILNATDLGENPSDKQIFKYACQIFPNPGNQQLAIELVLGRLLDTRSGEASRLVAQTRSLVQDEGLSVDSALKCLVRDTFIPDERIPAQQRQAALERMMPENYWRELLNVDS